VLPVHVVELPHLHSVAVAVALRGGPRFEPEGGSGWTHFLEHMLFRGAGERDARALMAAFEAVGGEPDAYTSEDALVIHLEQVAPDALEQALGLLASVLLAPRFEDLEAERQVILEEALDPAGELDDLSRQAAFPGHALGRRIIGRRKDVRACTLEDLEGWRRRLAVAGNAALVVAGPVTAAQVERAAAPLGELPPGVGLSPDQPLPPPKAQVLVHQGEGEQIDLRLGFRGPGDEDPASAAWAVLGDVLDGGPTGRVPQRVVDAGLAYEASAGVFALPDVSLLELDLTCGHGGAQAAARALLDVAASLGAGVDHEELVRGRLRRTHLRRALKDDAPGQAEWAVRRLLFGFPVDREAELSARDAVTVEEAVDLARALVTPATLAAAALGPEGKKQRRRLRELLEGWTG
jgi:predicted Zn-dependent peptidase